MPRPAGHPPARPRTRQRRRLPRPRLTGLGCGVLALAAMTAAAWICELLGGAPTLYGVLFVLSATATAVWVRPADLACAPIAAPISFAGGLLTAAGPTATVTQLALHAPWVFAGTLTAGTIALARRGLELLRRRLRRRRTARTSR
ncbi:DUF6542 domain-containing protein [Streptomyces litchfieldiae]|uniref:DUF6542 domain-containing protein n=1 Tax=Streptomyces litchfieldiae TaxID=3075543 RepID=A0ABU2MLN9_9ACTN|nr:DUF6542 domain-containing protein [Streptomyces sp. DSM 44938]MDT0342405.1 hypothetical protein [Streptomyces sp. DSM 44938]